MALVMSLWALSLLICAAGGLAARLVARALRQNHSSAVSAGVLLGPVLLGIGACASLIWPGLVQATCHCLQHGLHHPHLCLRHPALAEAALLPAGGVLAAWALLTWPRFARLVRDLWRTERWSKVLAAAPVHECDGVSFHLIDAPALGACTTGLLRPLIAIDRGLWQTLAEDERRAVIHHESAHRQRFDPLTLVILRSCAALVPLGARLLGTWHGRAEAECDRHAAARLGTPHPVAAALLKLEQQRGLIRHRSPVPGVAAAGGNLEQRVRALLEPTFGRPRAHLANDVLAATVVGVSVTVLLAALGGEAVHHSAETLLGLVVGAAH